MHDIEPNWIKDFDKNEQAINKWYNNNTVVVLTIKIYIVMKTDFNEWYQFIYNKYLGCFLSHFK